MKYKYKILILVVLLVLSFISYKERFDKNIFGYRFYIVQTDSMGWKVPVGSVIVTKNFDQIEIGNVYTFQYPLNIDKTITHRVVAEESIDDEVVYRTKGDKNTTMDPWYLTEEMMKGEMFFSIPFIGKIVEVIQSPAGLILLVILPLILVAIMEVDALSKETKVFVHSLSRRNKYKMMRMYHKFGHRFEGNLPVEEIE